MMSRVCGNRCLYRGGETSALTQTPIPNGKKIYTHIPINQTTPRPPKNDTRKKERNPEKGEPSFSAGAESERTLNVPCAVE